MEHVQTHTEKSVARQPEPIPMGKTSFLQEKAKGQDLSFLKLDCPECRVRFVLDVEEHWGQEPQEMDLVGRKFLGIPADAILCPRCQHEVEKTGAVRMYWSRAG